MFKFATQKVQSSLNGQLARRAAVGMTGTYLAGQLYAKTFENYERPVFQNENSISGQSNLGKWLDFRNLPIRPFRSHISLAEEKTSDEELLKKVQVQVNELEDLQSYSVPD